MGLWRAQQAKLWARMEKGKGRGKAQKGKNYSLLTKEIVLPSGE